MKQIAITAMLILVVTASAALVAYTGSLRAAGVFGLVALLVVVWTVRQAEWTIVRGLWRGIVCWVEVKDWRLTR